METWSKEFGKVLCKYREKHDNNFKQRIENGKVHICSRHFHDDDIQKTVVRKWINLAKFHQKIYQKNMLLKKIQLNVENLMSMKC